MKMSAEQGTDLNRSSLDAYMYLIYEIIFKADPVKLIKNFLILIFIYIYRIMNI